MPAVRQAPICRLAYAFMPKRMHSLRPVENVLEKAPYFIVIRKPSLCILHGIGSFYDIDVLV